MKKGLGNSAEASDIMGFLGFDALPIGAGWSDFAGGFSCASEAGYATRNTGGPGFACTFDMAVPFGVCR